MATVDQTVALIKAHFDRDDDYFTSVCQAVISEATAKNHNAVARRVSAALAAGQNRNAPGMIALPRRGEVAKLLEGWDVSLNREDLRVPRHVNREIDEIIDEYRRRDDLREAGFTADTKVLLEGPPGTGKTMTAAVIASELQLPMYLVSLSGTIDSHLGETGKNLDLLFSHLRTNPAVYVFDEIDAIATRRDSKESDIGEARRAVNTILMAMDRTVGDSVLVATTNLASTLDHALFRRFDRVIAYDNPTEEIAKDVLRRRLGPIGSDINLERLNREIAGLSHASLTAAAERTGKKAVLQGKTVTIDDLRQSLREHQTAAVRSRG